MNLGDVIKISPPDGCHFVIKQHLKNIAYGKSWISMREIKIAILISLLLIPSSIIAASLFVKAATPAKIVLENTTGRTWDGYHDQLGSLVSELQARGYEVVVATDGITPSILQGAQGLIMIKPKDPSRPYTSEEIQAIKNWFNEGGKFLWVASDSDYIEPFLTETTFKTEWMNGILEAVGTPLRFDYCSVEDPVVNAGAPYRVVSNTTNKDHPDAAKMTAGVTNYLFHGPTVVCGFKNGKLVRFEEVESDDVFWVFKTSENGVIVDNDPAVGPKAYEVGEQGSFVMMAAHKHAGPNKDCKIIVSAEGPYGDHGSFATSYKEVPLQGPTAILQIIDWGMTVEKPAAALPTTLILAIVVVIIIVIVAMLLLKKK